MTTTEETLSKIEQLQAGLVDSIGSVDVLFEWVKKRPDFLCDVRVTQENAEELGLDVRRHYKTLMVFAYIKKLEEKQVKDEVEKIVEKLNSRTDA